MNYLIYKITNTVNNKIYIGCHKTNNINDDYMGSGKILKRAIKKYGIDNFTKQILYIFSNSADMFNMESKLVNEHFVKDNNTYNLKKGGSGGFEYINANNLAKNIEHGKLGGAAREKRKETDYKFRKECSHNVSNSNKRRHAAGELEHLYFGKCNWHKQALKNAHSEEANRKRSITYKEMKFQQGENNSQFNTCWIYNDLLKENKKIRKNIINEFVKKGWTKGRKPAYYKSNNPPLAQLVEQSAFNG